MTGLFGDDPATPLRIELPDARLLYFEAALSQPEADRAFDDLRQQVDWREEDVVLFGKRHRQPRLVAWHGDPGAVYSYSGSTLEPQPWIPALLTLRERVERLAGATFNSVLLNLYRDEHDHMGWHSDDESELGPAPVIASLSLGATRQFQLKHKRRKDLPLTKLDLPHGSLLVMLPPTQAHWRHRIRKESATCGARINLTFRRIRATPTR